MDTEQSQLSFLVEFFRRNAELVDRFKEGDYSAKDELVDKVLEETKDIFDPQMIVLLMTQQLLKRL